MNAYELRHTVYKLIENGIDEGMDSYSLAGFVVDQVVLYAASACENVDDTLEARMPSEAQAIWARTAIVDCMRAVMDLSIPEEDEDD